MERITASIEKSAARHKKTIFLSAYPKIEHGIPAEEVQSSITLEIYNEEQFYRCVNWCNNRIGKGKQYWTVKGKVLKFIAPWKKAYNPPAIKEWVCFVPGVDLTPLLGFTKR